MPTPTLQSLRWFLSKVNLETAELCLFHFWSIRLKKGLTLRTLLVSGEFFKNANSQTGELYYFQFLVKKIHKNLTSQTFFSHLTAARRQSTSDRGRLMPDMRRKRLFWYQYQIFIPISILISISIINTNTNIVINIQY